MEEKDFLRALAKVYKELVDGATEKESWVLNPKDPGLIGSLDRLSAEAASALPATGGASIAAHADHLRYGLELIKRWTEGEQPFADADYGQSWKRLTVSDAEWADRRQGLKEFAHYWQDAITAERKLTEIELTGVIGSVVHLAYHLGAMRQIDRSMRGPSESGA
jgi:hypothetical protein